MRAPARRKAGFGNVSRVISVAAAALAFAGACHGQLMAGLQRAALLSDPAVAGAEAQVRAAEQRLYQSKAAFGPTAGLTLSSNDTRYVEAPANDLRKFYGKQASLQVTQPLYRSALFFSVNSAEAQVEQTQMALAQTRSEALVRLVETCFDVLKARDTISFMHAQQVAAEEQLASARRTFTIGKSAVTDVREAEAKVDTVAAQLIAAEAELELKQQLLVELVGQPSPELLTRGLAGDQMPPLRSSSVLEWLSDALTLNPQLRQAQQALVSAEAEVNKAWQGHAPTADLTYNYTMNSDTGTVTSIFPRRGDSSQVGVSVNIPLFASGATQSKVKEAVALRDKAQSDVDAARRAVQTGVRQNFSTALSSIALAQGLETANRSLEVAMRANRRGYEVGMKINSDVLESQSKLFEARRDLSRVRYEAWLNYFKLKAVAGRLAPADVDAFDPLLVVADTLPMRGRVLPKEATP